MQGGKRSPPHNSVACDLASSSQTVDYNSNLEPSLALYSATNYTHSQ